MDSSIERATASQPASTPAEELRQMHGKWRVANVQGNDNLRYERLPKETGLTEEKVQLVIEGNALLRDGKVIATLANDLSALGIQDPALFRRPLLIVLPDGRAVRCAYDKRHLDRSLDIAPPGGGLDALGVTPGGRGRRRL